MKRLLLTGILFGVSFCCCIQELCAQSSKTMKLPIKQEMPTVFLLGEYDNLYDEMMTEQTTLLDACDDNMNFAYSKLMGMMQEMEAYADLIDFDLKGINAWIHFFWDKDGTVEHIGFYLKPNSRNINIDLMKNFLEGFANQYKLPLKYSRKFSHYSSFSFPIVHHSSTLDNSKNTAKSNQPSRGN